MITLTSEGSGCKVSMELPCSGAFNFQGKAVLSVTNDFCLLRKSSFAQTPAYTHALELPLLFIKTTFPILLTSSGGVVSHLIKKQLDFNLSFLNVFK